MKIDSHASEKIRALSFLFSILIVGAHAGHSGANVMHRIFPGFLVFAAVPFFFLISGVLMFKDYQPTWQWWLVTLRKRSTSLYVPYLYWNVVYLVLKHVCGSLRIDQVPVVDIIGVVTGIDVLTEPACGPFWYIRVLIIFTLIAPVFGLLFKHLRIGMVLLIFLWAGYFLMPAKQLAHTGIKFISVTWFATGIFVAIHYAYSKKILRGMLQWKWFVIASFLVSDVIFVFVTQMYFASLCIALGLLVIWICYPAFENRLVRFHALFGLSFFIYAFHPLAITLTRKLYCNYYFVWIASFICCVVMGCIVRKSMRPIYLIMCGGR